MWDYAAVFAAALQLAGLAVMRWEWNVNHHAAQQQFKIKIERLRARLTRTTDKRRQLENMGLDASARDVNALLAELEFDHLDDEAAVREAEIESARNKAANRRYRFGYWILFVGATLAILLAVRSVVGGDYPRLILLAPVGWLF